LAERHAPDGVLVEVDLAMPGRSGLEMTLSLGLQIGRGIRCAREQHKAPFVELIALLRQTPYQYQTLIYEGKLIDVLRETTQSFALGRAVIQGFGANCETLKILFQNENLVARSDAR